MTVSIFKGAAQAALAVMLCTGLAGQSLAQGAGVTGSAGQSRTTWHGGLLATSLAYSETMLDRQSHVTDKIAVALRARQSGLLGINQLTFGGRVLGTVIHESTNTPGKFPILSRLPPTHTSGTSDSYGVINDITLNVTATTPLLTAFVQGEYTEVEYPGQNEIQLRKAWLAIGDLDRAPFYLAVGRKTVNFGNFESYAPFSHTHNAHYFWAQTKDPLIEIGYLSERDRCRPVHHPQSPRQQGDFQPLQRWLFHQLCGECRPPHVAGQWDAAAPGGGVSAWNDL